MPIAVATINGRIQDWLIHNLHKLRLGSKKLDSPLLHVSTDGTIIQQCLESLPTKPADHLRFVVVSDAHARHHLVTVPPGHVFIHCGDILFATRFYSDSSCHEQYEEFNEWLASLSCTQKVVIAGNHDRLLAELGPSGASELLSNATYLCNSSVTFSGINIFGSPVSFGVSGNSAFQSRDFIAEFQSSVTLGTKVLVTHGPLDSIAAQLCQVTGATLHLWGHKHDRYGAETQKDTGASWLSICASSMDRGYNASNGAVVIDFPIPTSIDAPATSKVKR